MTLIKGKNLLTLFVLLTFLTQSMVSVASSCEITRQSPSDQLMDMREMDHSMHQHDNASESAQKQKASCCCDDTCNCPVGGCISSIVLASTIHSIQFLKSSQHLNHFVLLAESQLTNPLIRPPISN